MIKTKYQRRAEQQQRRFQEQIAALSGATGTNAPILVGRWPKDIDELKQLPMGTVPQDQAGVAACSTCLKPVVIKWTKDLPSGRFHAVHDSCMQSTTPE